MAWSATRKSQTILRRLLEKSKSRTLYYGPPNPTGGTNDMKAVLKRITRLEGHLHAKWNPRKHLRVVIPTVGVSCRLFRGYR